MASCGEKAETQHSQVSKVPSGALTRWARAVRPHCKADDPDKAFHSPVPMDCIKCMLFRSVASRYSTK